eukprot:ctg_2384.g509
MASRPPRPAGADAAHPGQTARHTHTGWEHCTERPEPPTPAGYLGSVATSPPGDIPSAPDMPRIGQRYALDRG